VHEHLDKDVRSAATPRKRELKSEVAWLPGVLALLGFEVVTFSRGSVAKLPTDVREVYVTGMVLTICSLLLLLSATLVSGRVRTTLPPWSGLVALALAVAADVFVAASVATGATPLATSLAGILLAVWYLVWSLTARRSAL